MRISCADSLGFGLSYKEAREFGDGCSEALEDQAMIAADRSTACGLPGALSDHTGSVLDERTKG
jgi:hypothetical protein